jgi:hypothetical protein
MTKDGRALAVTDEAGHGFEFRNVPPGEYTVFAGAILRPSPLPGLVFDPPRIVPTIISGQTAVTLEDKDLDGIVVELRRGVGVSGKITGTTPPPTIQNGPFTTIGATLFLGRRDDASLPVPRDQDSLIFKGFPVQFSGRILNAWNPKAGILNTTADFGVPFVPPGKYTLGISWPTGASYDEDSDLARWLRKYYLRSISVAGQKTEQNSIDVPWGGVSTLEVQMAPATELTVTVRDAGGTTVPQSLVTVTPVEHSALCSTRSATADRNGHASFGVVPCDYYIQAWEYPITISLASLPAPFYPDLIGPVVDSDFREHFRHTASVVSVKEGSHAEVDLNLIPYAEIEVEATKIVHER